MGGFSGSVYRKVILEVLRYTEPGYFSEGDVFCKH